MLLRGISSRSLCNVEWVLSRALVFAALSLTACTGKHPTLTTDAGVVVPSPFSLGAHWSDGGDSLSFGVRSRAATRMEVWLYADARDAGARIHLQLDRADGGDVWGVNVSADQLSDAGLADGIVYYGYRAWGSNWTYDPSWTPGSAAGFVAEVDGLGSRFDPNKLLIDPYTLELSHDPYQTNMADGSVYNATGSNRNKDSAPSAAKSMALKPSTIGTLDTGTRPSRSFTDDIIYEVHLRGLTENDPTAPPNCAGTFKAAAARAQTLHDLGVTAVEFMPVQETQNDDNPSDSPGNYWGYNTIAFLAPDRRYACDKSPGGPTREFAAMVKTFHDLGLKVFLDVVYNHTVETGSSDTVSLRGLDNGGYYELDGARTGYADYTGLGGSINASSELVRDLVLASLHHWTDDLGVDGYRFDLAAVLGNRCVQSCFDFDSTDPKNILNRAVTELPGTPLIAEPWGIGSGTYQLGNFPIGWAGWNDQFRDSVKNAQNKLGINAVTPGTLTNDWSGSPNIFGSSGSPASTVNYIVSHDGFTLRDLYTCNQQNDNQPWPYGPSGGGTDNNLSWDQGGDSAAQWQAERTGMALMMISAGVPMITGGDEAGRSIQCNNNSYNLDSIATWLDWSLVQTNADWLAYVKSALAFRSEHPVLRPAHYRSGSDHNGNGLADETWFTASGAQADSNYLNNSANRFLGLMLDGTEAGDPAVAIYVAYNEDTQTVSMTLPTPRSGTAWYRAADTSGAPDVTNFAGPGSEAVWPQSSYSLSARSVAVFVDR
jgi:glycogen operon protein